MTIDTACSGSLAAVDVACRYLQSKELSSAIVAGANLYFGAEHVMDGTSIEGIKHSRAQLTLHSWLNVRSILCQRQMPYMGRQGRWVHESRRNQRSDAQTS